MRVPESREKYSVTLGFACVRHASTLWEAKQGKSWRNVRVLFLGPPWRACEGHCRIFGEHIMHLPWSSSFGSLSHASPKTPTWENSFPVQPIQSQPVLKASESLEFLPVLTRRLRETGIPERIILLGPSFPLTLTRLQQPKLGNRGDGAHQGVGTA